MKDSTEIKKSISSENELDKTDQMDDKKINVNDIYLKSKENVSYDNIFFLESKNNLPMKKIKSAILNEFNSKHKSEKNLNTKNQELNIIDLSDRTKFSATKSEKTFNRFSKLSDENLKLFKRGIFNKKIYNENASDHMNYNKNRKENMDKLNSHYNNNFNIYTKTNNKSLSNIMEESKDIKDTIEYFSNRGNSSIDEFDKIKTRDKVILKEKNILKIKKIPTKGEPSYLSKGKEISLKNYENTYKNDSFQKNILYRNDNQNHLKNIEEFANKEYSEKNLIDFDNICFSRNENKYISNKHLNKDNIENINKVQNNNKNKLGTNNEIGENSNINKFSLI